MDNEQVQLFENYELLSEHNKHELRTEPVSESSTTKHWSWCQISAQHPSQGPDATVCCQTTPQRYGSVRWSRIA